jgi:hypothetical protein
MEKEKSLDIFDALLVKGFSVTGARQVKNKKHTAQSAFFNLRALVGLLVCGAAASSMLSGALLAFVSPDAPAKASQRTLTFAERVAYQRAIEEVYWRHRIWPKERPDSKPSLDAVMPLGQLETKVVDYLCNSQALADYNECPITAEQLQAELDRMAQHTKQPAVLRELFEALGNDPFIIAECLARPVLTKRLIADLSIHDKGQRFALRRTRISSSHPSITPLSEGIYTLPEIDPCTDDTWTPTSHTNVPSARSRPTAVWTGSEMIVWGGQDSNNYTNSGGRYDPSTDSWTATSTTNAPIARSYHTAVWSGSEMIVWGGLAPGSLLNTGGRYNPNTDTWTATSTLAPAARYIHTAVWAGSEMIVWGGTTPTGDTNTGGKYNPNTDTWMATSTTNAPDARDSHTAVWTGG